MKCHTINLIAAGACLVCGIFYTVTGLPVTLLVVVGLVNLAFVLAK